MNSAKIFLAIGCAAGLFLAPGCRSTSTDSSGKAVKKAPAPAKPVAKAVKKAPAPAKPVAKTVKKAAPQKTKVLKETPLKVHYAMEKRSDFRATFVRDFKNVEYVDGGVTGKCFHVKVPQNHPKKGFAVHSGARQYTIFPGTICIKAKVKGKGRFTLGFILYNRNYRIYWITKAPGSFSKAVEIDTDSWVEKSFVFQPSMENVKEITGFLTAVSVRQGSDIYLDDIRTEITHHPSRPVNAVLPPLPKVAPKAVKKAPVKKPAAKAVKAVNAPAKGNVK